MAKYNLYLLNKDSVELALNKLRDKKYTHIKTFRNYNVDFDMYITKLGHRNDVWWIDQYSKFLPEEFIIVKNTSYSAMILAKTAKNNYMISMGKTHFYMNEFCDMDFGVDLAQRIGDRTKNKLKNSDYFGGARNKAITSNVGYSDLDFQSGESIGFLKLMPGDKEEWGKSSIAFGASVQFSSIDVDPTELGLLLNEIDSALQRDSLFRIPRSTIVKNKNIIDSLNDKLAQHIVNCDTEIVQIFDYEQFGVSFFFSEDATWKLKHGGHESELLNDLNLVSIKEFCQQGGIDLKDNFKDIKVSILVNGQSKFTSSLLAFLDYQDEGNYYLRNGRWYEFNQDFIDELHEQMSEIEVTNIDFDFSHEAYLTWKGRQGEQLNYKERYYNTEMAKKYGYTLYDRNLDLHRGKKIEVCDMYDKSTKKIIVTKRGEPVDLGYAIDQAHTVVKLVNHGRYQVHVPRKKKLPIHNVELLLIFKKRKSKIASLSEINSLTFQTKINDLLAACRDKGLGFSVSLGYESVSL